MDLMTAYDDEEAAVTLEHIAVLQERLGATLEETDPGQGISEIVQSHFDPEQMRGELLEMFTPRALLNLFQTEMGKGVILGAFIQKFILEGEDDAT